MKINKFYGKLNKVHMDKKTDRLYKCLRQFDIIKNTKEGSIANQKDWHYFLDLLFDGVYNDKD